jgi:GAF domain-containing protein
MQTDPADLLARLARELDAEADLDRMLQRVVDATLTEIGGAEHAGITLAERNSVSTRVATSDLVRKVDKIQYDTGEGPCLQAVTDRIEVIRVDDLRRETRWAAFTPRAVKLGVAAVLAFNLYAHHEVLGALNIYATRPRPFTDDSVHMGSLLAAHAALGLAATRKELNLQEALESRDIIGQAKGILMERFKITSREAFDMLVIASQETHRKLRDLASELATTGTLSGLE